MDAAGAGIVGLDFGKSSGFGIIIGVGIVSPTNDATGGIHRTGRGISCRQGHKASGGNLGQLVIGNGAPALNGTTGFDSTKVGTSIAQTGKRPRGRRSAL